MRSGFITTHSVNLEGNAFFEWETFGKVLFTGWVVDAVPGDYHIAYHCSEIQDNLGFRQELFAVYSSDPDVSEERKQELLKMATEKITGIQKDAFGDDQHNQVYDIEKHMVEVK
eukprot:131034_1